VPGLNALAQAAFDESRTFADVVHFVHVYTIEAHPMAPEPSPYSGAVWEMDFSTIDQAKTYEHRVEHARIMKKSLQGNQLQLVDALDTGGLVNPVWCTYGPSPNAVYLIGKDGTIAYAAAWTSAASVERAILDLCNR
jgi:hypothetical protein